MPKKHVQIKTGGIINYIYQTKEEIEKIKMITYSNFDVIFQPNKLKYKKPTYSPETCIIKRKTYSIYIYVPVQIRYKKYKLMTCVFKINKLLLR